MLGPTTGSNHDLPTTCGDKIFASSHLYIISTFTKLRTKHKLGQSQCVKGVAALEWSIYIEISPRYSMLPSILLDL